MEKYKCINLDIIRCVRMYQMDKSSIGINAGKIWNTLHDKGALTKHQIIQQAQISQEAFHAAVGWLARESKIKREGEFYILGETNLSDNIAPNAGKLMHIIRDISSTISQLHKVTNMADDEVNEAIGWLSREGKLDLSIPQAKVSNSQDAVKIQRLQEDMKSLYDDLIARNEIISELTSQLTIAQTNIMNQSAIIESLHGNESKHIKSNQRESSRLKDANERIYMLTEEIESLNHELIARNEIINEITKQLTDSQIMLMQQTDTIDHLADHIVTTVNEPRLSNTINERMHHIEAMEQSLRAPPSVDLSNETKRFEHTTPALHFQQEQQTEPQRPDSLSDTGLSTLAAQKKHEKSLK